jgi:hypothetical protein
MATTIYVISVLCLAAIFYRGIESIILLIWNLNWLYRSNKLNLSQKLPKFIVCIPALREQAVIKSTIRYFSEMDYPKNLLEINIVTTNKEKFQKDQNMPKVYELAQDIFNGRPLTSIKSKYLGIFTQDRLESMYAEFKNDKLTTLTKRLLKYYDQSVSTEQLALSEAEEINKNFPNLVKVVNYPLNNGVMSHQINYLVSLLKKDRANEQAIFVVYNADSRPNKETLKQVAAQLQIFKDKTGVVPNIVQQSSLFTLNYNDYKRSLEGFYLKASALFQTKWTLVIEITRFRKQSASVIAQKNNLIDLIFNTNLAHCVGHGLFVRLTALSQNNALPTETVNEDLPFGFYKCCVGEPILPLAILENSETPTSVQALMDQKKTWFWPYFEYLKCRNIVLKKGEYRSKLEVNLLTLEGVWNGIIWFFFSLVFLIPLVYSISTFSVGIFGAYLLGLLAYWFIPNGIIYYNLKRLEDLAGKQSTSTSWLDFALTSLSGLGVLFIHSVGPFRTALEYIKVNSLGGQIVKLKTER